MAIDMTTSTWEVHGDPDPLCPECDGDGYTERFNDDQTDVITAPCEACYGPSDDYDGVES